MSILYDVELHLTAGQSNGCGPIATLRAVKYRLRSASLMSLVQATCVTVNCHEGIFLDFFSSQPLLISNY